MVLNNVREWRMKGTKRRGLPISQAQLARRVKVCRSYIAKLERGKLRPNSDVMLRLAEYFDCAVEDIFSLSPDSDKQES